MMGSSYQCDDITHYVVKDNVTPREPAPPPITLEVVYVRRHRYTLTATETTANRINNHDVHKFNIKSNRVC